MRNIRILINNDTIEYIQRLYYEVNSYRRIVNDLILFNLNNPNILDSDKFNKYHNLYIEKVTSYSIVCNEMLESYLPKSIYEFKSSINWSLDFKSHLLNLAICDNIYENLKEDLRKYEQ